MSDVRCQRSDVRGRWHQELKEAVVASFNSWLVAFEILARVRRLRGWPLIMARNEWFQGKACACLARNAEKLKSKTLKTEVIIFAYSYAAREIFRFAKQQGWKTVLGQIDPGPVEEKIVAEEAARVPELADDWQPAPVKYWDNWQEECSLADHIIVNSEWSRTCLEKAGVNGSKLSVVPLAYESPITDTPTTRAYPARFTPGRPLRVLFLGQVNLRKGVARLFDAIRDFKHEPIEFWFVGPVQVPIPDDLQNNPRVRWFGVFSRSQVDNFYREADLLLFPTLSDGFGLTQLEAQAWSLPVVASRFCGEVVRDGVNGIVLPELSPNAIVTALQFCLRDPARLRGFATNALKRDGFDLKVLAERLLYLFSEPADPQAEESLSLNKQQL